MKDYLEYENQLQLSLMKKQYHMVIDHRDLFREGSLLFEGVKERVINFRWAQQYKVEWTHLHLMRQFKGIILRLNETLQTILFQAHNAKQWYLSYSSWVNRIHYLCSIIFHQYFHHLLSWRMRQSKRLSHNPTDYEWKETLSRFQITYDWQIIQNLKSVI